MFATCQPCNLLAEKQSPWKNWVLYWHHSSGYQSPYSISTLSRIRISMLGACIFCFKCPFEIFSRIVGEISIDFAYRDIYVAVQATSVWGFLYDVISLSGRSTLIRDRVIRVGEISVLCLIANIRNLKLSTHSHTFRYFLSKP